MFPKGAKNKPLIWWDHLYTFKYIYIIYIHITYSYTWRYMYSCISCDFVKKYDLKVAVGACNLQTHVPQTCTVNRKNTKSVLLYNPAWRGVVFGACMVRRLVQAWNPWPCTLGITTLVAICAPTHPCNFGLGSSWCSKWRCMAVLATWIWPSWRRTSLQPKGCRLDSPHERPKLGTDFRRKRFCRKSGLDFQPRVLEIGARFPEKLQTRRRCSKRWVNFARRRPCV